MRTVFTNNPEHGGVLFTEHKEIGNVLNDPQRAAWGRVTDSVPIHPDLREKMTRLVSQTSIPPQMMERTTGVGVFQHRGNHYGEYDPVRHEISADDVSTAAHELGHAIHLNADPDVRLRTGGRDAGPYDAHLEGVAEGVAKRWGTPDGGALAGGYRPSDWSFDDDRAVFLASKAYVDKVGDIPDKGLVDRSLPRGDDSPIPRYAAAGPGKIQRREVLHALTAAHPEVEAEVAPFYRDELTAAHQQHAARQGPVLQTSWLVNVPDASGNDMQLVAKGSPLHRQAVERGDYVGNLSRSQFGELHELSDEEAWADPSKMLPKGVVTTERWAG